jgi:hypothetical protein
MASEPGSSDAPVSGQKAADGGTSRQLRAAAQQETSRRAMLRRGSVVAAASIAGLTLLDQRRAQAADGSNFVLGQANNANSPTVLTPTTNGDAPGATNPWFHINGGSLAGTSTTMEVDGPGGPIGTALRVNGNAGGVGINVSASSTAHTVGLALAAECTGGDAVHASSNTGSAVVASSGHGTGVAASSSTGNGVTGSGARGGVFTGGSANVRLTPHKGGHPRRGLAGDLFVDNQDHLWYCRGGTTWVKLA